MHLPYLLVVCIKVDFFNLLKYKIKIKLLNKLLDQDNKNELSKGLAKDELSKSDDDWNSFHFNNKDIFKQNKRVSNGIGPCGWAANAPACSSACYYLGWTYYTYWFATSQCCCS